MISIRRKEVIQMKKKTSLSIQCHTEYDNLEHVVVVAPKHMAITEVINETQNYYAEENINIKIALEQHQHFIDTLKAAGITVYELDTNSALNEQVFTRDIGFVIGKKLFVSHMDRAIRKQEIPVFTDWLKKKGLAFLYCETPSIEGGDVIIDGEQIWVGISGRTTYKAVQALQAQLPDYCITPIHLKDDILHLDCAFNVIDEHTALIYRDAMYQSDFEKLKEKYTLIEVTAEEQFAMGPNVLAIGEGKLISLPENERINTELKSAGFNVIEVPFSEIIKSGGSYRCCTLPLLRK